MENANEVILHVEEIVKVVEVVKRVVKEKKPRSEKQLENDRKLRQRLKDKKLKEQLQLEQLDRQCVDELNVLLPIIKKPVRPRLTRNKSIHQHPGPTLIDIREEIATA